MATLSERLNFSNNEDNSKAIEIKKWHSVNHYETLCKYCADNDIELKSIEDSDFDSAVLIMEDMGQADISTDSYFFWIDND
jgi:hypothetical protein